MDKKEVRGNSALNTILKGIIVEIKDDYIIALKNTGDMVRIKNKGSCEIGDSIMFFTDDIVESREKSVSKGKVIPFKKLIMPLAAIAAVCLIFFSNIANILLPTKGYAVVSMDINPSLQLELSDDEKILKVKSLNKDAEKLFDGVKGMELKAGMEAIRDILLENNYKLENSDMLIGFTFINGNDNKEYEDKVQNIIKEVFNKSNVAYIKGNEEELKEAEKKGVSLGRYEAEIDLDDLDLDEEDVSFIIDQLKKGNKINLLNEDLDDLNDDLEEELDEEDDDNDNNDLDDNSESEDEDDSDDNTDKEIEEHQEEQEENKEDIHNGNEEETENDNSNQSQDNSDEHEEDEDSIDSEDVQDEEESDSSDEEESSYDTEDSGDEEDNDD